jgi:hypothetical protein
MIHSFHSPRAAEIAREQIQRHYHRRLADALKGEEAGERAAILFALVAGFQVMRQVLVLPALAEAEPDTLVRLLTPSSSHWSSEVFKRTGSDRKCRQTGSGHDRTNPRNSPTRRTTHDRSDPHR